MSKASSRTLIVGAGPSGLICALTILENGGQVRIIEKSAEPRLGQRGAGIMPRSTELLERLGIADEVLHHAIAAPPVRKYELPRGTTVLQEFEMAPRLDPTPAFPYLNPVLLGQPKFEQVIQDALARHSCKVERGVELVTLQQFDDEVEVKLKYCTNNDDESVATERYDWIVGADGARSNVRKEAHFIFNGETKKEERLVVGDIHVTGLSEKYWHMWGEASNVVIALRPTEVPTLFNFTIGGLNVNHVLLSSDENALKAFLIDNVASKTELTFGDLTWLSLFTPNIRMVESFQQKKVFLVGDAGHVHSPTGGQGMNSGIQDAFNLGWKLALVQQNLAPPSLLQTYSEERIPVIREMLGLTTRILTRTFNDKGDGAWDRSGGLLQLGINCRWSSIVLDDSEDSTLGVVDPYGNHSVGLVIRAGDRAPDAPDMYNSLAILPTAQRLFSVFGPYHTVLIFEPSIQTSSAIIQSLTTFPGRAIRVVVVIKSALSSLPPQAAQCGGLILEDRGGHAHVNYRSDVERRGVVVVRPDGIIGAIVGGTEGLEKYFRTIFHH